MDTVSASAVVEVERLTLKGAELVDVGGVPMSRVPLHDARPLDPEPAVLEVSTLKSFAEYALSAIDDEYRAERAQFVHVEGGTSVRLCTGLFGDRNQRVTVARAKAIVPSFPFGSFLDAESFNIAILTHFEETPDRANVLKLTGNLTTEAVQTVADDGVTQQVTARHGIARRADVEVKAILTLKPYRTFSEVAQPESPFVLRLRGGGNGESPKCALFEADGGRWKLAAVSNVKSYLSDLLSPADIAVYG